MNRPDRGTGVLRVVAEANDSKWSAVPRRDVPKHLQERYWIDKWSGKRWPQDGLFHGGGKVEIERARLGRTANDPGDGFFWFFQATSKWSVSALSWVEVTQVCIPGQDEQIKLIVRQRNGIQGKGSIDEGEFLRRLERGLPDPRRQRDMADRVVEAIEKKAGKGRDDAYNKLVEEYGRGVLIVGLPLWFAGFPAAPDDPGGVLREFTARLGVAVDSIDRPVLRKSWCPFDTVCVLWTPTGEALDAWAAGAKTSFYNDPANASFGNPLSPLKLHGLLDEFQEYSVDGSVPEFVSYLEWRRYQSVDALVRDQRRFLRLSGQPRPFGPKSEFEAERLESPTLWRAALSLKFLWVLQFVRVHGWRGLSSWVMARLSPGWACWRWKVRRVARQNYVHSRPVQARREVRRSDGMSEKAGLEEGRKTAAGP